ncbi:RNA-binding protein [Mycolicibacterium mengxianglii]|uniref:RNA-binding protein n=1 Tax=Mycolicibacterium mengxianglii TaxID=2736649 RepID=UPI0027DA38B5|nr:RNA-binding protein [Mycolicibacterium mengxianglii]
MLNKMIYWIAAAMVAAGAGVVTSPAAQAVCGSIGGMHVDVTGCADPLSEINYLDAPPPPPPPPPDAPPPDAPPPPPPPPPPVYTPHAPNVDVCANVGRRISVSGCI